MAIIANRLSWEGSMGRVRAYDISIIRPQITTDEVTLRGRDLPADQRAAIGKALRTLHTLELMAQTIYKFQITHEPTEFNRSLVAAMLNEMTHYQDFQTLLYEYGMRPGVMRWAYWILGLCFGTVSRMLGKRMILKTGIWVETKAVRHYGEILDDAHWDPDIRRIIEKNQADEDGHVSHWSVLLDTLDNGGNI